MPLLNYRIKIWKKNLSGQFFCQNNFFSGQFLCPDNFFVGTIFFSRTIFLSRQFFCSDYFLVRTIFLSEIFFCPDFFLSGQKGIYHQVEFCRILYTIRWEFCHKLSFVRVRVMAEFLLKWERTSQTQVQVHQSSFSSIPIRACKDRHTQT